MDLIKACQIKIHVYFFVTYIFGSSKKVYNKITGQKPLFGVPSGPLFLFVKSTKAQYFQHFIAQPFNTVPFFCDFRIVVSVRFQLWGAKFWELAILKNSVFLKQPFWCFPWFPASSLLCVILRYTVYILWRSILRYVCQDDINGFVLLTKPYLQPQQNQIVAKSLFK